MASQRVEAGYRAVFEPPLALPFGSLGLLLPGQDSTAGTRSLGDFVEACVRASPTENAR